MAADLYRRAYRIDPSKPEYLFGAARAEQKAGRPAEALLAYQTVLALMPSTEPLAKKAQTAIDEIRAADAAKPAQAVPPVPPPSPVEKPALPAEPAKPIEQPKPVEPPQLAPPSPPVEPLPTVAVKPIAVATQPAEAPADWKKPTGWALVATGGVALVGGAILGALAASGRSSLDANKLPDGVHYDPSKITHDGIVSQQTAINSKATGAIVCGAVGVVAAGVGAWALLTAPSKVAFTPGPGVVGVGLASRF